MQAARQHKKTKDDHWREKEELRLEREEEHKAREEERKTGTPLQSMGMLPNEYPTVKCCTEHINK